MKLVLATDETVGADDGLNLCGLLALRCPTMMAAAWFSDLIRVGVTNTVAWCCDVGWGACDWLPWLLLLWLTLFGED